MSQIDTIKAKVSPADAGRHYGLKSNRSGMAHCPFHNDKKPSMCFCALRGKRVSIQMPPFTWICHANHRGKPLRRFTATRRR